MATAPAPGRWSCSSSPTRHGSASMSVTCRRGRARSSRDFHFAHRIRAFYTLTRRARFLQRTLRLPLEAALDGKPTRAAMSGAAGRPGPMSEALSDGWPGRAARGGPGTRPPERSVPKVVGVDETSFQKRHEYVTVVCDPGASDGPLRLGRTLGRLAQRLLRRAHGRGTGRHRRGRHGHVGRLPTRYGSMLVMPRQGATRSPTCSGLRDYH